METLFYLLQVRTVPFILPIHNSGGGRFDPEKVKILLGSFIFLTLLYVISLIKDWLMWQKEKINPHSYSDSFLDYHFTDNPYYGIGIFNGIMFILYLVFFIYHVGKLISNTFL